MFRRGRITFVVAGCVAALGAMLLIPNGREVAVADAPVVAALSSAETIAAIDALLGTAETTEDAPAPIAAVDTAPRLDTNLQTAALTQPAAEPPTGPEPATDLEGAPLLDPNLRPDRIGDSAVNLRAGPSSDTATVTVLQPGQAVQTGESDGGWVEVTLDDGTTGWVYSRYLASVAAASPAPAAESTAKAAIDDQGNSDLKGRTARISSALVARASPDANAERIFRTSPGERVRILGVRGNWLHIVTADGNDGWIRAG